MFQVGAVASCKVTHTFSTVFKSSCHLLVKLLTKSYKKKVGEKSKKFIQLCL